VSAVGVVAGAVTLMFGLTVGQADAASANISAWNSGSRCGLGSV
jgi:hypothetical protein